MEPVGIQEDGRGTLGRGERDQRDLVQPWDWSTHIQRPQMPPMTPPPRIRSGGASVRATGRAVTSSARGRAGPGIPRDLYHVMRAAPGASACTRLYQHHAGAVRGHRNSAGGTATAAAVTHGTGGGEYRCHPPGRGVPEVGPK